MPAPNYQGERTYLLTLCFDRRRPCGTEASTARWLIEGLRTSSAEKGFLVHAYCVMPDHMHALVAGTGAGSDLLAFVNAYKQETGFAFQRARGRRLWQFKFYDHILRGADGAESVAWYIWLNPVRKGLCTHPQEYPHSGSFTEEGARLLASFSSEALEDATLKGGATRGFPRVDWLPPWKQPAPG